MKIFNYAVGAFLVLFTSSTIMAQNAVKRNVEKLQKNGEQFEKFSPFSPAAAKGMDQLRSHGVEEAALLDGNAFFLAESAAKSLQSELSGFVRMELPEVEGEALEVLIYEQTIFTDDAVISANSAPDILLPLPDMKFYRGIVSGKEQSLVALTIADEEINGVISYDNSTYVLGKIKNSKSNVHVFYKDDNLLLDESFSCEAIASDDHDDSPKPNEIAGAKTDQCVRMRLELDEDLVDDFGSVAAATNYTSSLFNQTLTLFANDDIDVAVAEIFAWDNNSPYTGSIGNKLGQVSNNYPGSDLTQLLTAQGGGGIAYLSGLCSNNFGVSVSGIFGFFFNVPSYSWDVNVTTHEIGHNLSSPHTHACSWNGNNTAIDGCGPAAGYSEGCTGSVPSGGGTIMSYCHLLSTGMNFNLGFGPQPTDRITNYINSRSCLGSTCITTPVDCDNETLTLSISLDEYPQETTWELTDGSTVIDAGGPYNGLPFTTIEEELCVVPGCYTLTFFDSFGDGICCGFGNGSYTLTDESGTVLVTGGEFEDDESNAFCLDDPTACDFLNFNEYSIQSYIPSRDNGNWAIQEGGTAIFLEDNSLKYIPINYDVTSNTTLSFEFRSTDQGSIHAIAMETDANLTLPRLFKLHGTLNNGQVISDFDNYSGSSYTAYTINVGSYYTGNDLDLVVISANVNGSPGNNSYFRNVRLYEGTSCGGASSPQGLTSSASDGEFILFPNPTRDNVELTSLSDTDIEVIRVFSITGALIEEIVVNGTRAALDFSEKSQGIYLIQWSDSNGQNHQERLVKTQ